MFGWIVAGFVFVIVAWLLGHTGYLMTQMRKEPAGKNGEHGEKGEMEDGHR